MYQVCCGGSRVKELLTKVGSEKVCQNVFLPLHNRNDSVC